ncbi:2-oxoacid:acceptor oxidoreductase subunit alpha [Candidatus Woesearchaeota archaeon]|nr:2-oxoacid:acceptor oxidoreductase subunit alpha [Candidatus Woesearchaeota archaeon]
MTDFTWKIAGPAGLGIMTTGLIFSKAFSRGGYHVFDYIEYPSLIRGGHNTYQCRISSEAINSQSRSVHILVALNKETVDLHKPEMLENSAVIYDNEKMQAEVTAGKPYPIPLTRLAKESGGKELMANNVALGASMALLDYDLGILEGVIRDMFGRKGEEIVKMNMNAANAGYNYVRENFKEPFFVIAKKISDNRKYLLTGNEAIGAGAVASGCKCFVAYPMTPASSILHYLAENAKKYGIAVRHAEDEISVINTAIGAAHAGARTMTATSGGGFALMVEGYGLAAMTETPLVIVEVQRPGPATGMPTWSGQGDLRFVMHAHQDDFPRVVMTPGDVEEAYYCAAYAHNLAEKYQTPIIIMSDKHLAESHKTAEKFDHSLKIERGELIDSATDYKRYKLTKTGISPRLLPGAKGAIVVANSDEHNEYGYSCEEIENRNKMMQKRMKKLDMLAKELPAPKLYGPEDAELTLTGFGSVKGAILDAIKILEKEGIKVNFLHLIYVSPFPDKSVKEALSKAKKVISVENNFTGQFAGLVREKTGKNITKRFLKYDGRPFYPEEIAEKVRKVLKK